MGGRRGCQAGPGPGHCQVAGDWSAGIRGLGLFGILPAYLAELVKGHLRAGTTWHLTTPRRYRWESKRAGTDLDYLGAGLDSMGSGVLTCLKGHPSQPE